MGGRVEQLYTIVDGMTPWLQLWLKTLLRNHGGSIRPDTMSDLEYARLCAFLIALGRIDPAPHQLPDPEDPQEMSGFVGLLNMIPAIGGVSDVERVSSRSAVGFRAFTIESYAQFDELRYLSVIRRYRPDLINTKLRPDLMFQHGRSQQSRGTAGRLFQQLARDLDSARKSTRLRAQSFLRGTDKEYRFTQGFVYAPFVTANREALLHLLEQAKGANAVVSLERGGSYVADQLEMLALASGVQFPPHVRVRKPTREEIDGATDAFRAFFHPPLTRPQEFDKKTFHTFLLVKAVEDLLVRSTEYPFHLVVTVTLVGGGSTNGLLKALGYLANKHPRLRIRLLLHRHTFHQDSPRNARTQAIAPRFGDVPTIVLDPRGGQSVQLTNFSASPDMFTRIYGAVEAHVPRVSMPQSVSRKYTSGWGHSLAVSVASGRYVIGEDIDVFLDRNRHPHRPLVLFSRGSGDGVAVRINPGPWLDSRRLLQMVVSGAFDSLLNTMGVPIAPTDVALAPSHRSGFK